MSAESVATLRKNLLAAAAEANSDASKIVGLADRLLHATAASNDVAATIVGLRCKIIALLRQKRFDRAAAAAKELQAIPNSDAAAATGRFFRAVCEYRQGNFAAAEQALLAAAGSKAVGTALQSAAEWNLLAQARYNQNNFRGAAEVYETELLGKGRYRDEIEQDELLTNLAACYAAMADVEPCAALVRKNADAAENSSDILFNYATALAQKGRFADAAATLANAEKLCIFQNELTPETADFLAPTTTAAPHHGSGSSKHMARFIKDVVAIKVQQAFVQLRLGNADAAERILNAVVNTHSSLLVGTAAYAAACLNWTAIKRHSAFIDSYNRLRHIQQPQIAKRLTPFQRECAAYNQFLLSLGVGKAAQARSMAEALCRDFPDGTLGPRALAAMLASTDSARAEQTLRKVLAATSSSSSSSVHQTLTMAQLTLERGEMVPALEAVCASAEALAAPAVACTVLAGFASLSSAPAAYKEKQVDALLKGNAVVAKMFNSDPHFAFQVATQVLPRLGRHAEAAKTLERIAAGSDDPEKKKLWLGAAALEFVRARDVDSAARLAAAVTGRNLQDPAASAANSKYPAAQCAKEPLPKDVLAAAGFATGSSSSSIATGADGAKAAAAAAALKEARKRPLRRPVEDKSKPLDPERWIPWSMRTYVKDMPPRRRLEAKRKRAQDQEDKRRANEKKKREAAAAAAAAASSGESGAAPAAASE